MRNVTTLDAPPAIGPYSQAIVTGRLCFCSGQLAMDPKTGEDVKTQTAKALENLAAVLTAAGTKVDRVVKVTVYLADMNDFGAMNEVYAEFFGNHKPARAAVEVARLPRDARVEIDAIAMV